MDDDIVLLWCNVIGYLPFDKEGGLINILVELAAGHGGKIWWSVEIAMGIGVDGVNNGYVSFSTVVNELFDPGNNACRLGNPVGCPVGFDKFFLHVDDEKNRGLQLKGELCNSLFILASG